MKQRILLTLIALAVSAPALAEKPGAESVVVVAKSPTGAAVGQATEVQATVTAIDKEKRTVTIKGPQGKLTTIAVGEEAKNFDQVKVGDVVTLTYFESFALQLEKAPGAKPGKVVTEGIERSKAGEKPGGVAQRQVTIVGTVTAVDAKTQLVTVAGPEGNEVDIKVQDPAKLKNVKKGDLVKATYTEALAIAVNTPAKADAKKK